MPTPTPNDSPSPHGWELSLRCAERLGWHSIRQCPKTGKWVGNPAPAGVVQWAEYVPAWHQSLDACFRDLVWTLKEQGWNYRLQTGGDGFHVAEFARYDGENWHGHTLCGSCPAEAICLAFLAATQSPEPADADRS